MCTGERLAALVWSKGQGLPAASPCPIPAAMGVRLPASTRVGCRSEVSSGSKERACSKPALKAWMGARRGLPQPATAASSHA